jgi:hypothetical protein
VHKETNILSTRDGDGVCSSYAPSLLKTDLEENKDEEDIK